MRAQRFANFPLRFEVGERVPQEKERFRTRREMSGREVLVTIHKIRKVYPHEDGATLMRADVSIRDL